MATLRAKHLALLLAGGGRGGRGAAGAGKGSTAKGQGRGGVAGKGAGKGEQLAYDTAERAPTALNGAPVVPAPKPEQLAYDTAERAPTAPRPPPEKPKMHADPKTGILVSFFCADAHIALQQWFLHPIF
jgi:hypothetical protein